MGLEVCRVENHKNVNALECVLNVVLWTRSRTKQSSVSDVQSYLRKLFKEQHSTGHPCPKSGTRWHYPSLLLHKVTGNQWESARARKARKGHTILGVVHVWRNITSRKKNGHWHVAVSYLLVHLKLCMTLNKQKRFLLFRNNQIPRSTHLSIWNCPLAQALHKTHFSTLCSFWKGEQSTFMLCL